MSIPTASNMESITYTVQPGDTLYGLAQRYQTTVNDIVNANNLTTDVLFVGQTLTIPGTVNNNGSLQYYTVQRGDSLWSIARRFNTTVNEIQRLNNLNSTVLQIGQQLLIPGISNGGSMTTTYIVQPGDSLWSIANRFNATVNELMMLNNLNSTILQIGQVLQIPN